MATSNVHGSAERIASAMFVAGAIAVVIGLASAVAALVVPVTTADGLPKGRSRRVDPLPDGRIDPAPLLNRMAGTWLIKPPVVQAAVKDSGLAGKLVKRLQLEGVIQSGPAYVAYIRVDKTDLKTVRQGESVLELTVSKIEPGRVTLTLEGVDVALTH